MRILKHTPFLLFIPVALYILSAASARGEMPLPDLIERVRPAVVTIFASETTSEPLEAIGSGFFVTTRLVVTNHHVVEGTGQVEIGLASGDRFPVRAVIASEPDHDLALLEIGGRPDVTFTPLRLSVPEARQGESVIVMGSPLGLGHSVSQGIVSALRELSGRGRLLQITAPVSPGSSGSPVLNGRGEVIGVVTFQASEGQALNFAVSSGTVHNFIAAFLTTPTLRQPAEPPSLSRLEILLRQRQPSQFSGDLSQQSPWQPTTLFRKGYGELMVAIEQESIMNLHSAVETFREVLKREPDRPEAHYALGIAQAQFGDWEAASLAFSKTIELADDSASAHYSLAVCLIQNDEIEAAFQNLQVAMGLRPSYVEAKMAAGYCAIIEENWEDAAGYFREALHHRSNTPSIAFGLGYSLFRQGEAAQGSRLLTEAARRRPDLEKTAAALAAGEKESKELIEIFGLSADLAEVHLAAAKAHAEQRDLATSEKAVGLGLLLQPENPFLHVEKAILHSDKRDWENAIRSYTLAIRFDQELLAAYAGLARMYRNKSQVGQGISVFNELIRLRPGDAAVHRALGNYLSDTDFFGKTEHYKPLIIEAYSTALELEPGELHHYVSLMHKYSKYSDWASVIRLGEDARSLVSDLDSHERTAASFYALLGRAYLSLNEVKMARELFITEAEKEEVTSSWQFLMGNAYEGLGDTANAIQMFEEAVELEPANPHYLFQLAQCYLEQNDEDSARSVQKRLRFVDPFLGDYLADEIKGWSERGK